MNADPERTSVAKGRAASLVAKLAVAAALVYWLLATGRLDVGAFRSITLDGSAIWLIMAGAVGVLAGQLLMALRLRLLLRSHRLTVSPARTLGLTLIGSFSGAVLPGLVAGDAVKAFYLFGDAAGRRSRALAVVLIDRVVGLYSLFLLGTIALAVAWLTGRAPIESPVLWIAPAAVLAVTAGAVLMAREGHDRIALLGRVRDRLPTKLGRVFEALRSSSRRPGLLAAAVGLSLANHALVVLTFWIAGVLLGSDSITGGLPTLGYFVLSPLAMVMNVVPLTPGGIGITEGAFSLIYASAGSAGGGTIGLLGRLIQYLTFVGGGCAALLLVRIRGRSFRTLQPGNLSCEGV
ncbi:MAG: hypothetical protein A2V70_08945 [Planctomycetes bacterium RBG_13_63_9]|nr:MAG: hypothetical protein A2V70_08945 [Planctomycetes bacterium RBG_13_63_9]